MVNRFTNSRKLVYSHCHLADGARGTQWRMVEHGVILAEGSHLRRSDAVKCAERYRAATAHALQPLPTRLSHIRV